MREWTGLMVVISHTYECSTDISVLYIYRQILTYVKYG